MVSATWMLAAVLLAQQPAVEPGVLPKSWATGGPNCLELPDWQVHEYNTDFFILRESGCSHYEKPFLYLIFGDKRALLYDLPFGKGKKYMSNGGALAYIVGNWTFSGMIYAYTGNPLTVTSSAACNCPGGTQTANQVADVQYLSNAGPGEKWFSPESFVAGPANTWGTAGRNTVTGPGRVGTDMNLARIFPIGERFKLEIRADAFNLTNTPAFANPTVNVNSATYAEIRSTAALSERQFRFGGVIRF